MSLRNKFELSEVLKFNEDIIDSCFHVVTNSQPAQVLITKVKRYLGTRQFAKRSQWSVEQLRQVNGINPDKVTILLNATFYSQSIPLF